MPLRRGCTLFANCSIAATASSRSLKPADEICFRKRRRTNGRAREWCRTVNTETRGSSDPGGCVYDTSPQYKCVPRSLHFPHLFPTMSKPRAALRYLHTRSYASAASSRPPLSGLNATARSKAEQLSKDWKGTSASGES